MGVLEISLIVIGLLIIAVSYVISEKMTNGSEEVKEFETVEDYEKRKQLEENTMKRFEIMAEDAIEKVDATICRLSNEKIMAVNEYGDMVLERIDKNHSEVVFLYSMLTDKEKELKQQLFDPSNLVQEEKEEEEEPIAIKPIPSVTQAEKLKQKHPKEEGTPIVSKEHERILSYLNEGKTIREISKELGLGQGEVQLVANLYAGGRKQ